MAAEERVVSAVMRRPSMPDMVLSLPITRFFSVLTSLVRLVTSFLVLARALLRSTISWLAAPFHVSSVWTCPLRFWTVVRAALRSVRRFWAAFLCCRRQFQTIKTHSSVALDGSTSEGRWSRLTSGMDQSWDISGRTRNRLGRDGDGKGVGSGDARWRWKDRI